MNKKQKVAAIKEMMASPGRALWEAEMERLTESIKKEIVSPNSVLLDSWKNDKNYTFYDLLRLNLDNLEAMKEYPKNFVNFNSKEPFQQTIEGNIG